MSSTPQGTHSLAFRVMRLCNPSNHRSVSTLPISSSARTCSTIHSSPLTSPLLLSTHVSKTTDSSDMSFADRYLLHHPSDAKGFSDLLLLPQSFRAIYLGETFCSYISINNSSIFEVKDVIIKAGIMISLWNTMSRNLEHIRWFALHGTMMVVNGNTFHSFSSLLLRIHYQLGQRSAMSREIVKPPILVRSDGGIHNYFYQIKFSSSGSEQMMAKRSNILGKLQITWRTNLGEPGRLQTQQILGTPRSCQEIELQVLEIPSLINLDRYI